VKRGKEAVGGSPFPPIADYGFLSDCHVTALVAPSGNVEWLCLPRFDGPSVFGAILDRDAGGFRVGPADVTVPAGRRYLPGTNVLETTWVTRTGWLIVRDALTVGPWHHEESRSTSHRRPPTDYDADHVLLRTLKCVQGSADVELECEPVFDYGQTGGAWDYLGDSYHDAGVEAEGVSLRLVTDLRLGFEGRAAIARTTLREGETAFAALSWSHHDDPPMTYDEAFEHMERTSDWWREWLAAGQVPDHRWRHYLSRSALTLKGLTYAPTGAMIAAPTTSLPETPGGARNWDYRYSWIRDSTLMLWGIYTLGFDREADEFFYFVADAVGRDGALQVMYGVEGERRLEERELPHLEGYARSQPVRVGNGAFDHEQHDVWGAFLDSVYLHMKARTTVPEWIWPIIEHQVEHAIEIWRRPDRGIWEVRGEPRHFTHSKVMCWVAADRGARLAELRNEDEQAARWQAVADEIHAEVCERGVDERGVFRQHYDTDALDASALMIPLVRFLPPDDPRVVATVCAIEKELTRDGLVMRYRAEDTDDGLGGAPEGSFVICSFWLVSALSEIGETERARDLCEKLLAHASPLNLYAEEIDTRTGRHLGNFPQAFSHLGLINAVMHVIADERAPTEGILARVRE
jgi:GH15 family glucan-1,4-alpha-glucosidase